ncbi:MAG: hypothetical protein GF329_10855 [Candidatus Lokiarchaeota archaeon]|nr:hypothetical protein [Candidatus Lokiarchaeota archaeon]
MELSDILVEEGRALSKIYRFKEEYRPVLEEFAVRQGIYEEASDEISLETSKDIASTLDDPFSEAYIPPLLPEEQITYGYFLIQEELYGENNEYGVYYGGPFFQDSSSENWNEQKKRHDDLLKSLYPKDSPHNPNDFLEKSADRRSDSGATHYPGKIIPKQETPLSTESINLIKRNLTKALSKFIESYTKDDKNMMGLYLLEKGMPLDCVRQLICPNIDYLIEAGLDNRNDNPNSWRVIFNPDKGDFNHIERRLNQGQLDLIGKVVQLKTSLKESLKKEEREYLSLISTQPIIIDKQMGTNYSKKTLKKYRKKMRTIHVDYSQKLQILSEVTHRIVQIINLSDFIKQESLKLYFVKKILIRNINLEEMF